MKPFFRVILIHNWNSEWWVFKNRGIVISWYRSKVLARGSRERAGAFSFVPRAPGLVFSEHLSTGEFCPLRIPFDRLRAAASPIDKCWKDSALPPVTAEKAPALSFIKPRMVAEWAMPTLLKDTNRFGVPQTLSILHHSIIPIAQSLLNPPTQHVV